MTDRVGIEFTDRYQAMGIPYPSPETMCHGQCEGTGYVPIADEQPKSGDEHYRTLWENAHRRCSIWGRVRQFFKLQKTWQHGWRSHWSLVFERCDGWHFVVCPDCGGSGKRTEGAT